MPRAALRPAATALALVALAVLLRWPASVFPALLPDDVNSQHHIVVFADLLPTTLDLGCPPGAPERTVLAAPLRLLFGLFRLAAAPVAAWNLSLTAWVALHGGAGLAMGRALGWARPRQRLTAVAFMAGALGLQFLNSGRVEHTVLPWFALIAVGMRASRPLWGGLLATLGLALAAHSSPYQAVPGGILVVCLGLAGRRPGRALAVSLLAALPTLLRWHGSDGAHSPREMPVGLRELLWDPPGLAARLGALAPPAPQTLAALMPDQAPPTEQYLGPVLLVGGLLGLWRARRHPLAGALLATALLCGLLALGTAFHPDQQAPAGPVLPWAWLRRVGPLANMASSSRFLTGAAFALAVGLGALVRRSRAALALGGLLVADSLLAAPSAWPAATARVWSESLPAAPAGSLVVWPPLPWLPPALPDLLTLQLDHRLTLLPAARCDAPQAPPQAALRWLASQPRPLLELRAPVAADPGVPRGRSLPPTVATGTEAVLRQWP